MVDGENIDEVTVMLPEDKIQVHKECMHEVVIQNSKKKVPLKTISRKPNSILKLKCQKKSTSLNH